MLKEYIKNKYQTKIELHCTIKVHSCFFCCFAISALIPKIAFRALNAHRIKIRLGMIYCTLRRS